MLNKIQHTTLLEIVFEFMIHSKVMFKSIEGPDNTSQEEDPQA